MEFKEIRTISDVRPAVASKQEIRFIEQPGGLVLGTYVFADANTFDSPEALECRGIVFDSSGAVVSRPLHKFFNVGERESTSRERVLARDDVVAVFDKLDGSMVATAWVDGRVRWRSRRSFDSEVLVMLHRYLGDRRAAGVEEFARLVSQQGMTAVFEWTHPEARVVLPYGDPGLHLLHVRENVSGRYVLLDPKHEVHEMARRCGVPLAPRFNMTLAEAIATLETLRGREGYVVQFADGDMVKLKCPWYLRMHGNISVLRERTIATLALHDRLDDTKAVLLDAGIDLSAVATIEAKVKRSLIALMDEVEAIHASHSSLDRKSYAIALNGHPYFALLMQRYSGRQPDVAVWYERNRLDQEFGTRSLLGGASAEAMEG